MTNLPLDKFDNEIHIKDLVLVMLDRHAGHETLCTVVGLPGPYRCCQIQPPWDVTLLYMLPSNLEVVDMDQLDKIIKGNK